jgi:TRAP transporter 4TM/12TM fusion protein
MSETKVGSKAASPRQTLAEFRDRATPEQILVALITVIGIGLTVGTMYFAWKYPIARNKFAVIFFGVGVTLYYLSKALDRIETPANEAERSNLTGRLSDRRFGQFQLVDAAICLVSAVTAAIVGTYVTINFFRLSRRAIVFGFNTTDLYVGLIIVALTIDATRRAYGWAIALVTVASVAYALLGSSLPGFLSHSGFQLEDIATFGAVRIRGAFSFIMEVGATWVAIFIMFAGLARAYGALDFILGIGQKIGQNLRSGVVHVAIITSMAMGSITGSATANTATTGSFTIPMMKRQGVRKDYAAAIESVASSGGQIMPPVMGVAAFLMATIIGVSYVRIIQAALIPALLFYFSVGIAVQFVVLRYGWTTERENEGSIVRSLFSAQVATRMFYLLILVGSFYAARIVGGASLLTAGGIAAVTLLVVRFLQAVAFGRSDETAISEFIGAMGQFFKGGHFGIPIAVLLYTLVIMQLSPLAAGLYTTLSMIATMIIRDQFMHGPIAETSGAEAGSPLEEGAATLGRTLFTTLKGFKWGALDMAPLVGVLAAIGVITAMVTETGLTGKISTRMVALAGGVLLVALLLAMITSILFGLGMPTPAAYILVATLLTAPLQELGVATITSHLFVFYFAMLSAITPPVAVAVAVGSNIADSGFMITAKQSLRIGVAGFVIPFALVTNDSLITWTLTGTPISIYAVFVGVVALTAVTIGHDGQHKLGIPHRLIYIVLSLLALFAPALGGYVGSSTTMILQVGGATLALLGLGLSHIGRIPQALSPRTKEQ